MAVAPRIPVPLVPRHARSHPPEVRTDTRRRAARRAVPTPWAALLLVAAVAACTGPGATATPAASATPGGSLGPIAHPTGADEVILRYDVAGGFVPMEWAMVHVPRFTLYGDGTVIFVDTSIQPPRRGDGVVVESPIRTTVLDEEAIQELIAFALREGGLAIARERYENGMVMDAPTTTFELNADGDAKTVAAYALGLEGEPDADAATKALLVALTRRLDGFDPGGAAGSLPWAPLAYRAWLREDEPTPGSIVRSWPWTAFGPGGFVVDDAPGSFGLPSRVVTAAEAALLAIDGIEGGMHGLVLAAPAGGTWSLVLRPLLPDEFD